MNSDTVMLKLPPSFLNDANSDAANQDVTIGHLVRQLLKKEVERRLQGKMPDKPDEPLIAALQALLCRDMSAARNWQDLAIRLRRHGYEVRPAGGRLTLYKSSCGTRICKASELGFAYRTLVNRFACAMPDHPDDAPNHVSEVDASAAFDVIEHD
jgi:hypothetical protein